ncbi:rhamnulokinase family protein [uncultured Selenomonas sp.]|uniref:rhamnulokinase n=1 Tax=uncultured Selenomonas sp. TaxID=159275 RepID=UPI0028E78F2D|nr:rhamnulokinase family protein [uncultured Selenomonas sp.]
MTNEKCVLSFDLGASGGRAVLGAYDGSRIRMEELHRFTNDPVHLGRTMYWDVLRLFHEMKQGLLKARGHEIASIGTDTWGVDFGLLDADGCLLENPVHYRDRRTVGIADEAFQKISRDTLYRITGNQIMEINTIFQLLALKQKRPELLERAKTLLLMPDLLNYFLSGEKKTEYSIATTTQMLDARSRTWSREVLDALGLPAQMLTEIVPTATPIGHMTEELSAELGMNRPEIIAVAGHDTQSAMAGVPTGEEDFIFLSCGTWSLLGTELREPVINAESAEYNITNEGGYGGRISFLKNLIGLWLIQESRRQWMREGHEYSYGELEQMAAAAPAQRSFIRPDDPAFLPSGDMPLRIRAACERTGQPVPESVGAVIRCIDESLALSYRAALTEIEQCTKKHYDKIYLIGGGVQSRLLAQLTADACGRTVLAGPIEATVLGNIALQLIAAGEVKDLAEARALIRASSDITAYEPKNSDQWDAHFEKWKGLTPC